MCVTPIASRNRTHAWKVLLSALEEKASVVAIIQILAHNFVRSLGPKALVVILAASRVTMLARRSLVLFLKVTKKLSIMRWLRHYFAAMHTHLRNFASAPTANSRKMSFTMPTKLFLLLSLLGVNGTVMATEVKSANLQLAEEVAKYYADPYGFVRFAFPWGEPGMLERESGPDEIQKEFLQSLGREVRERKFDGQTPVLPIRMAESSGHGTGKSAMGAWIAWWILSTRPFSVGTISAGTYQQLETKTWAAVKAWGEKCITARWFEIQESGVFHKRFSDTWKVTPQTCKEQNAQSFAGQHARQSTSWYLFDEASEVPDKIWETAEGGLTDGEPMFFVWGQPVRNTGEFYKICFGEKRARWNHRNVDSRQSRFTSKALIEQWIADYGIDSDFCKVRVLGLPPSASELQYIDKKRIDEARNRKQKALANEPLVAGFDVSGGGKAWNVIRFRRGLNGDPGIEPIRIPGERDADRSQRLGICAELLRDQRPDRKIAAMFIDTAFGAPIAVGLRNLGFTNVFEVNAGGESPDIHCLNMRAFMWMKSKEWLLLGALRDDEELASQLALPGYHINNSGKLVIESKRDIQERGEKSPDDADAFNLTFTREVRAPSVQRSSYAPTSGWS